MKGTLYKTEKGWEVINIQATLHGPLLQSLPLFDDDYYEVNRPGLYWHGKEVEFEILEFPVPPINGLVSNSISKYAKLIDSRPKPMQGNEYWMIMKEGDINVHFKPLPAFDDPGYLTKAQQLQVQMAEECFRKHPNNEILYPTNDLKDAYKAGVIDGFKEANDLALNNLKNKQ